jgi:hypothetical protein
VEEPSHALTGVDAPRSEQSARAPLTTQPADMPNSAPAKLDATKMPPAAESDAIAFATSETTPLDSTPAADARSESMSSRPIHEPLVTWQPSPIDVALPDAALQKTIHLTRWRRCRFIPHSRQRAPPFLQL